MAPLGRQGAFFAKAVRDLCYDQGKEAELILRGEQVEMDKRILDEMKDPLTHILRNCVDHGVQSPERRKASGKPERATITLAITQLPGNKLEIAVSDDGAGIDPRNVRESAIQRGLVSPEEAERMSEAEALGLIFRAEVSTSPMITEISGRGLGLAIVRERAEKLGGRVTVESQAGVGTTFRITLPAILATFRGILVETAGRLFVLPTAHVERVGRFTPDEVATVGNRETLSLDGAALALVWLDAVLQLENRKQERPGKETFVVVRIGDDRIVFIVDAVRGEQEVLVKKFRKPLSRVRNIAGATILASGEIAPILNAADLLKSARRQDGGARPAAPTSPVAAQQKAILVAEDSITSRMLIRGILESAGYRVKTAVDGMDALTALRTDRFDLVVSDVEMPRLNGFDLTARIRADKKLAELPVVLVTALETREDRERGVDVGANAYIIKSSFDQSNLLEAVRRFI
jgi:two-component system chemotaxis sensor kinase CheA